MKYFLENVVGSYSFSGRNDYHSVDRTANIMPKGGKKRGYEFLVGVELEMEAIDSDGVHTAKDIESNWFFFEKDGSLSSSYGFELVTIPMTPAVVVKESTWDGLLSYLRALRFKSHDAGNCGLHVHISRSAFGKTDEEIDATLAKVLHMYHNELGACGYGMNYITAIMRRGYVDYAKDVTRSITPSFKKVIDFTRDFGYSSVDSTVKKKSTKDIAKSNGQDSRYSAINREGSTTIEFRQGRGTLKTESVVATIQFCIELVEFCRDTNDAKLTRENFIKRIAKLPKHNPLRAKLVNVNEI